MAESKEGFTGPERRICIDIPNVTDATKVSDLTVGQLVELLVQVNPQLPLDKRMPAPEALQAAFTQVRDLITGQSADTGLQQLVRQMQQGILEKMPDLIKQTAHAPLDGGPGLHATRPGT